MPEKVRQIGLKLSPELIEWLEARAKAEDRPLAYVVRRILIERKAAEERRARAKTSETKAKKAKG